MAGFFLDSDAVAEAERLLRDCTRYVLFDQHGMVLAASFQADPSELVELARAFDLDRDEAIRRGIALAGARFEVHRHHPAGDGGGSVKGGSTTGLIYGRTMGGGGGAAGPSGGGGGAAAAHGHGHEHPPADGAGDHGGPAGASGVFGAPAWAEGAAACRVLPSRAPGGGPLFGAATYALPQGVSARMVPLLRDACERLLGPVAAGED